LLIASDELLLEELFEHVQDYLIEKQSSWICQNLFFVLHAIYKLVGCKKLRQYCFDSISENPLPFITSETFLSIDKDILYNLLSRDDLQSKEIVIWDYLIKWGIEQTPGLENDRTNWNDGNYEALRRTLNNFFHLIRITGISREDIVDKVYPYKAIIPNYIYKQIEEFYHKGAFPLSSYSSPRKCKIRSNIIKSELIKIITNWIDKKSVIHTRTGNDPYYKFNLIYRGSRNGINNISIKNKCNGRVASLVLIKTKQSDKIFGGYSSIGLNSLGDNYIIENNLRYYSSSDNFIFSFENSSDTQCMRIGRVVNKSKAILVRNDHGFNFGQGSLCVVNHNLYLNNFSNNYNNILSKEIIYSIEEIETFIVDKS
jgi:hypothetical protein